MTIAVKTHRPATCSFGGLEGILSPYRLLRRSTLSCWEVVSQRPLSGPDSVLLPWDGPCALVMMEHRRGPILACTMKPPVPCDPQYHRGPQSLTADRYTRTGFSASSWTGGLL